jgi:tripartite-type tricarboxylate transporter receptor subunit TctC
MNIQRAVCGVLAAGWLAAMPDPALSQTWPARTVTIVVPFTPGVTVDISARVVGEQVSKQVGQPVVIENRGGAGGTIGAGMVAKSAPDGHTLLVSGSLGSANAMFANLPYDTLRDFVGVHSLGLQPLVLVSGPDKPFKTLRELIAAAKAKPGALNYASGGMGSATHLAGERIRISAGIDVQHVPFKGAGEALREVMAGRVDFYATPVPSALALIRSGKVVALAVSADSGRPCCLTCPRRPNSASRILSICFTPGCSRPPRRRPPTCSRSIRRSTGRCRRRR